MTNTIDRASLDNKGPIMINNMAVVESILSDLNTHYATELTNVIKKDGRPVSLRTIQIIIKKLNETYNGLNFIEHGRSPKGENGNTPYRLQNNIELVFPEKMFTSNERNIISSLLKLITVFDGALPMQKLLRYLKIKDSDIKDFFHGKIDFEYNKYIGEWISVLYDSIILKKVVEIDYQPLNSKEDSAGKIVSPYCLKNFNNRWYLIGHVHIPDSYDWTLFPLDRIRAICSYAGNKEYKECNSKVIKNYYKYIVGFHVPQKNGGCSPKHLSASDLERVNIKIKVNDSNIFYYIKTNPIHRYQRCNGSTQMIELDVIENTSLYTKLLSFGGDIEVLEPTSLRDKIKEEANRILNLYKTK